MPKIEERLLGVTPMQLTGMIWHWWAREKYPDNAHAAAVGFAVLEQFNEFETSRIEEYDEVVVIMRWMFKDQAPHEIAGGTDRLYEEFQPPVMDELGFDLYGLAFDWLTHQAVATFRKREVCPNVNEP